MEEFKQKLVDSLEKKFASEKYEIRCHEVVKNNDTVKHGVCVTESGCICGASLYIEDMYDLFQILLEENDKESAWEQLQSRIEGYVASGKQMATQLPANWQDVLEDYESVKERIIFRLINVKRNSRYLTGKVYIPFLDLGICFFILANDPEKEQNVGSVAVSQRMIEKWGVTKEELFEVGKENMKRLFPAKIETMSDIICQLLQETEFSQFMNPPVFQDDTNNIYILTNKYGINGAATLCYEGILRRFSDERDKSNVFIVPCSLHELILILDDDTMDLDADKILEMVQEVNGSVVQEDEILADSVYYYDRAMDEISLKLSL